MARKNGSKPAQNKDVPRSRDVAVNRRALQDYEIIERVEAGISLTGSEIKSVRQGKVSLQEAYARPDRGEIWLQGAHIAEYAAASYNGHEPRRPRRLLLHKSQIAELAHEVNAGGESHPVGGRKPNGWGLYDMHGNVWEWCEDAWHESYQDAPLDGSAWMRRGGVSRVVRGGGWGYPATHCGSAFRWRTEGPRYADLGFRVAATPR